MYDYSNITVKTRKTQAFVNTVAIGEAANTEIYPFVVDIGRVTVHNDAFRAVLRTGEHLQLTVMCIPAGEDIGLEVHPHADQFLCIQEGYGQVRMGETETHLPFVQPVFENHAVLVPAGTWHNLINTGTGPLKLYSLYAPPQHARGAFHATKAEAEKEEHYTL